MIVSSNSGTIHIFPLKIDSMNTSMIVGKNKFSNDEKGLSIVRNLKSYLKDIITLPTSTMKLHLQERIGCNWVAKEGTLMGPIAVFSKKGKLVCFSEILVCGFTMWFSIQIKTSIRRLW